MSHWVGWHLDRHMDAWYKRWKPIELNKFVELVSLLKIMTIEMKRDKWKKKNILVK